MTADASGQFPGLSYATGGNSTMAPASDKPSLTEEQPDPIPNDGTNIWDLVIADMREKDRRGIEKYGTPLQTNNGRDALVDAYQEALDLTVYLRQAIEERNG